MLRNIGIRWQILAALVVPLLVLVGVGGTLTYRSVQSMNEAADARSLAETAPTFNDLIVALGTERLVSVAAAATKSPIATAQLPQARSQVDQLLNRVRNAVYGPRREGTHVSRRFGAELTESERAHSAIPAARRLLDDGAADPQDIADAFTKIIDADAALPSLMSTVIKDKELSTNFARYGQLGEVLSGLSDVQLAGVLITSPTKVTLGEHYALAGALGAYRSSLTSALIYATADQKAVLQQAQRDPQAHTAQYQAILKHLRSAPVGTSAGVNPLTWITLSTAQITAQSAVLTRVSKDGIALANDLADRSRRDVVYTAGGSVAVLLVMLLVALLLARRISLPLRRLTAAATKIREELPQMVARVQAGEDVEVQDRPGEHTGRNEVGRLAAAFVDVNAVTVQIAKEQVQLRAAVGDMFVNIARRNQVLLARQLSFIDQLERNEADPDSLEDLFRLDHLATRMRRNAESLLVLAGIESGRRLRETMPLSDVLRTATSEIEHYERVSITPSTDPSLHAHLALPVAHLLAELIENATNFSDPGSTVAVTGASTGTGVRVTIADEGLGMTQDEVDQINDRIVDPPTAEALGSQHLGFFVVGRLAQRLGAGVELSRGAGGGTTVVIDLPGELFVGVAGFGEPDDAFALPVGDLPPADLPGLPVITADEAWTPPVPAPAAPSSAEGFFKRRKPQPVPEEVPAGRAGAAPAEGASREDGGMVSGFLLRRDEDPAAPAHEDDAEEPPYQPESFAAGRHELPSYGPATSTESEIPEPAYEPVAYEPEPVAYEPAAYEPGPEPPAWAPSSDRFEPVSAAGMFRELMSDPADPAAPAQEPGEASSEGSQARGFAQAVSVDILPRRNSIRSALARSRRRSVAPVVIAKPGRPMVLSEEADQDIRGSLEQLGALELVGAAPVARAAETPIVEGGFVPAPEGRVERQALASEALSELSRLSSYAPASMATETGPALQRRTPSEMPSLPETEHEPVPGRTRTAASVRSMLSGFKAGVERGRTSPSAHRPAPNVAAGADGVPQPRQVGGERADG